MARPGIDGLLTHEELLLRVHYDPETGGFTRLSQRHPAGRKTSVIGTSRCKGYKRVRINGVIYLAHRLAWFYMTGVMPPGGIEIDHIDRDRANNKWSNLRLCTRQQNAANQGPKCTSLSGARGVGWHAKCRKWQASVTNNGKNYYLGLFDTIEDASAAYHAKARELFGEFAP